MASAGNPQEIIFNDPKTSILANILLERQGAAPMRLLVVGCGSGIEAAVLAQRLGTAVTGIDIVSDFDKRAELLADLHQGDATQMKFDDESFDFVYSFHVLEHIPDYQSALREMHRVLKPKGGYLIGTPNRSRLIGYLGSIDTTLADKARWNIADWKARLRGEFHNELGAHAGYALDELQAELARVFTLTENITSEYYTRLYGKRRLFVSSLCHTGLWRWLFPAIYFCGIR